MRTINNPPRKSHIPVPPSPRSRTRRSGKPSDILMRTPGLGRQPDASFGNDPTFINSRADEEDEWTDEEPAPDEDSYFHWEEEATLFSDLLEEASPEDGEPKLIALAESLQKPFDDESRQLKREIAKAFVPLVNNVKRIYTTIDRTVDIPFGAGLLAVNDACKEMEKSIGTGADTIHRARTEHQERVSMLLHQLEEEYAQREQLWANFQRAMDDLVNPVLEMLNEAPAKMERTIVEIEKQSKALEKANASAPAHVTAQALKDILSKLK